MIPILILAAGQSRRMGGRDKLLEDVDGEPLLVRQAGNALALGGDVYVALATQQQAKRNLLQALPVKVIDVPEAEEGLSGTMRGAVARLPGQGAFMVMLADLVDLGPSDLQVVYNAFLAHPDNMIWRGATPDLKPGHPIIFNERLRPDFAELSGDSGGESLVKPLKDATVLVPFTDDRARLDLDTLEDWETWRKTRR